MCIPVLATIYADQSRADVVTDVWTGLGRCDEEKKEKGLLANQSNKTDLAGALDLGL